MIRFSSAPAGDFGPHQKIFSKKVAPKSCFLADDLASGHISWSHFGESRLSRFQGLSASLRMHFSTCYGVWVVWISIPDRGSYSSHTCAWAEPRSQNRSIVSTHKNFENLKMKDERWKLTKFPHCFLTIGWRDPHNLITSALLYFLLLQNQIHGHEFRWTPYFSVNTLLTISMTTAALHGIRLLAFWWECHPNIRGKLPFYRW
jgi:hypothetical protein